MEVHVPEMNPESFILYEDDEFFSAMQFSESHVEDSTAPQGIDDSSDNDNAPDHSAILSVRNYFHISAVAKMNN